MVGVGHEACIADHVEPLVEDVLTVRRLTRLQAELERGPLLESGRLSEVADADVALRRRVEEDRGGAALVLKPSRCDQLVVLPRPLPVVVEKVVDGAVAGSIQVPQVDSILISGDEVLHVRSHRQ